MATMYKYHNVDSRVIGYLPEGTAVEPGKDGWTYTKIADTPILKLVGTKDDGKKTMQQTINDAVAAFLTANPVAVTQAQVDASVTTYITANPITPTSAQTYAIANYLASNPITQGQVNTGVAAYLSTNPVVPTQAQVDVAVAKYLSANPGAFTQSQVNEAVALYLATKSI